ncbi:hypothetical protein [Pandoraea communis]|nr:hypothetical protein [Pandoraea communis]
MFISPGTQQWLLVVGGIEFGLGFQAVLPNWVRGRGRLCTSRYSTAR